MPGWRLEKGDYNGIFINGLFETPAAFCRCD